MTSGPVIFVDDDPDLRRATTQMLTMAGFEVRAFDAAEAALDALDESFEGPVVTDIRMPRMNGLQLFERIKAMDAQLPVLLVTGHADVELAVAALKDGVYDFISKPFDGERLATAVAHAAEKRRLVLENRRLRAAAAEAPADLPLIGDSPGIRRLRETIRQVADADVDVLVVGETGSGKEVVASLLHRWSRRQSKHLVALNCGALPETVLESELFGHEVGAFTGAVKGRMGKFEYAHNGTLFLDEIESMPMAVQVKLLRALQDRSIERVGSNLPVRVDCRIIAASKEDLKSLSDRRAFRSDLYYRIGVAFIVLPPLRERREDIPLLFEHFVLLAARRYERSAPLLTGGHLAELMAYNWPGNIRELRNVADRLVLGVLGDHSCLTGAPRRMPMSLPEQTEQFERAVIEETLQRHHGEIAAAAKVLQLPKQTMYDKLRRLRIEIEAFR